MDHKQSSSGKRNTLSKFFKEEKQSPSFHHLSQVHNLHDNLSPTLGSPLLSNPGSPLLGQSPESLWSYSPLQSPLSHPSLLYCCISSLHRDGDLYSIAVLGDHLVLTGSCSRRIHAWQALDCHAKGHIQASSGEVRAMVAHGETLFTSHKDHKIRIWNIRNCNSGSNNNFRPKKITTLPYNGNNNYFKNLITRPIITTTPQTSNKPTITPLHKDIISCMAYYYVEGILYTGSYDTTIKAWRVNEKKCVDSFIAHGGNVNDMVVNQQNGYLFTCSSDGTVKMWLRVYGENSHALIKVLTFHTYPIYALALSMSPTHESVLYAGSSDGCINFWDQQNSCRYTHGGFLQGHKFAVLCLVTVENLLISGSEDSTIRIWKREKGGKGNNVHDCLAILEGHRGPIRCLNAVLQKDSFALSFLVYSASLDQTFKVWRVKLLANDINYKKKNQTLKDDDDNYHVMDDNKDNFHHHHTSPIVLSPSWVKNKLRSSSLKR